LNQASFFPLLTRDVPLHAILLLWGQFPDIPSTVFILGRTDAGSEVLAFILDTVMLLLVERYALTQGQYLGSIATDSAIWRSRGAISVAEGVLDKYCVCTESWAAI
jgi:hypothetical protein